MKIVDTNILLYAIDRDAIQHQRIRVWLENALNADEPSGIRVGRATRIPTACDSLRRISTASANSKRLLP